jgi:hypothetical protein
MRQRNTSSNSVREHEPIIGVHSTAPQSASDPQAPITIERVERGLSILAYLIERDGPVYVPHYEKLERELEALRRQEGTIARARRRLENFGSPQAGRVVA